MDSEYILMCREAEEIQRLWKPRIGDVIAPGDSGKLIIGVREEENTILLQEWGDKNYWVNDYDVDDPVVWLPRQEDLQELIFTHIAKTMIEDDPEMGHYSIQDFKDVYGYEFLFDEYYYWVEGNFKTFNELWLCFAMDYLFSKKWDSDKKEWVKMERD